MNISKTLKSFKGGVHPKEFKFLTEEKSFEILPTPKEIFIPINQNLGKPPKILVKKGDEVKCGDLIAEADGFISSPIHSSVSGKVIKISKEINVNGFPVQTIIIQSNENEENNFLPKLNLENVTAEEIINRVKEAGIVGLGGASFPTHVKITPQKDKPIDLVLINACECEPYLTRDYRLILEKTNELINGLKLIMKALNVRKGIIGIEDNKPLAIEKLNNVIKNFEEIEVKVVKTKYPQGAEKMLIKAITGREVPPKKLPFDVGVAIQNVATAISIYEAVVEGIPMITSTLTVSGLGINEPKNLIVKNGTPLKNIIEFCGGIREDSVKIVVGGPMMGVSQFDLNVPVMKATSGILVLTKDEVNSFNETNCLRCGMCVDVCPLNLIPTRLARFSQLERYEDANLFGITNCMECGTCAFTCPANIQLVQWIKLGKQKVIQMLNQKSAQLN
ncbi:MAG: electron transport complex subunit RsxC [Melioribacteraceae bacterium]|nr:electron transport complex subunit RsxC [Melioribacteraceae bacterium]